MATTLTGAEHVQWDLSDLYGSVDDPALDADIEKALADAAAFAGRYRGRIGGLTAAELYAALAELETIESVLYRVYVYAQMHFSTDNADPDRGALLAKVQERYTKMTTELLFTKLEWAAVEDGDAERLMSDPALQKYRHTLEVMRLDRPHLLTEPEEKVLAEKSLTGATAWGRLFEEQTSALRVNVEGEGDDLSLDSALALSFLPDRDLRRRAAEGVSAALAKDIRTRGYILNTLLLDKSVDDRLRKYPHWLAERNISNEASDASVTALIEAVESRYDIPQRYYRLKAKLLGLDKLADYDRNAALSDDGANFSWPDARELVVSAYRSFSDEAGNIVGGFFEKRWIDAAATPNKSPGAYCMTMIPDRHPYVLMNYTGDRRSVLTLAHELGHGLHGFLSNDLGLFNAHATITLSETASVFGEALTFGLLMKDETDPQRRLGLLAGRLEDSLNTSFRQIAFNRFEDKIHTERREKGEISIDRFNEIWLEVCERMFGDSIELTPGYERWWSYIEHFVGMPGYVYGYTFGYLFSLAIYQKYLREGDSMVEPYMDLLRAGGSDTPERLAKIVGIDLGDPGFWSGGLESLDDLLKEAEELAT